jgi:hypothetical protein
MEPKSTSQHEQLQAYLHGELPAKESDELTVQLSDDRVLQEELAVIASEEAWILSSIRAVQCEPSDAVETSLSQFHQMRLSLSEPPVGANVSVWARFVALFADPVAMGAMACAVMFVALVPAAWLSPIGGLHSAPVPKASSGFVRPIVPKPVHRLVAKGGNQAPSMKHAFLHIGAVRGRGNPTLVGDGDTLRTTQRLRFSFVLKKAGFVYLLLESGGRLRVLYPFGGRAVQLSAGRHSVLYRGVPQQYRLQRHTGNIAFVLLHTSKAFPPRVLQTLSRHRGSFNESLLERQALLFGLDRISMTVLPAEKPKR